jgi:hypothetical protein
MLHIWVKSFTASGIGKNQLAGQIQPNNIIQCQQKPCPKLFSVYTYIKYDTTCHKVNIMPYRKNTSGFYFVLWNLKHNPYQLGILNLLNVQIG